MYTYIYILYMYVCMYVCIYVCIYIEREGRAGRLTRVIDMGGGKKIKKIYIYIYKWTCAVRLHPLVWQCVRSISERAFLGSKFSRISSAHNLRPARNLATYTRTKQTKINYLSSCLFIYISISLYLSLYYRYQLSI